ncbi:MAG: Atxe2 family lasso peptide isopeptidase [Sphingomonas sp.]|jgi:dipeptidyl aminopeptidase/acylaminoacyl peptidase|uniref:Atxe2 family lasso peptide isopeptidase n=1 Tax=Sphingomonas sp. TaxID=28214 RepID=UPI0035697F58
MTGVFCALGWVPAVQAAPACAERLMPAPPTADHAVTARDLIELRDFGRVDTSVGGPAPFTVSPDGAWAALILRRADADVDDYCFGVMLVSLDRKARSRLLDVGGEFIAMVNDIRGIPAIVNGSSASGAPIWSPDGRSLAYLRRDRGVTQAWRVGLDGRPAEQVSRLPTDALDVAWAADGTTLLITTRPALAEGEPAIDREGRSGFLYDSRFWSLSESRPRPALPLPVEIRAIEVASGATHKVTSEEADRLERGATPDPPAGAGLYARSTAGFRAWVAYDDPRRTFGQPRLHIEARGRAVACPAICDDHVAALWWTGPDTLLFMRGGSPANGGRIELYRWRVGRDRAPSRLFDTTDALLGCSLVDKGLICARETAVQPRALVRLAPQSGRTVTLFDPNPEFGSVQLGKVERLTWNDRQGVHSYGDLALPPTHRSGERHPLIVVQYQSRGFLRGGTGDEYPIHLLASRGYAVLSFQRPAMLAATATAIDINAVQRINIRDWAERRMIVSSLQAGIDAAIARGVVDPGRIGLTGLSDGAVTAQFALNGSNRFRAAVISSCCDDPSALFAVGPAYRDAVIASGYPPPGADGSAFWAPMSLEANAARFSTPLLIQAADAEYRLGLESFSALRYHGAPVEMYVYPDEHHVKWHPAHRLAVYERTIDWFDFWLKGEASEDPDRRSEVARWEALRSGMQARRN